MLNYKGKREAKKMNVKMLRVIFSYDGSMLKHTNINTLVISLKDILSKTI